MCLFLYKIREIIEGHIIRYTICAGIVNLSTREESEKLLIEVNAPTAIAR